MNNKTLALILGATLLTAFLIVSNREAEGASFTGQAARVSTTSTIAVGPSLTTDGSGRTVLFQEQSICAARIITTVGQPISLSFDKKASTTPSATLGHEQLASTTVVYDSGLFGCGQVTAYGYGASTTITITETR